MPLIIRMHQRSESDVLLSLGKSPIALTDLLSVTVVKTELILSHTSYGMLLGTLPNRDDLLS